MWVCFPRSPPLGPWVRARLLRYLSVKDQRYRFFNQSQGQLAALAMLSRLPRAVRLIGRVPLGRLVAPMACALS